MAFRETRQTPCAIQYLRARGGIFEVRFLAVDYHRVSSLSSLGNRCDPIASLMLRAKQPEFNLKKEGLQGLGELVTLN